MTVSREPLAHVLSLLSSLFFATAAIGAEFHSTSEAAVLYDAPSIKAKPLFVLGRDVPIEVIVAVEGWYKIRDATGTVAWIERKSAVDKRTVVVRAPLADVLAAPEANAAVVFKVEQNVLLELADASYVTSTPGWAKVRHRDGQIGYVRIAQVWGL
jgi:SH3-like domain-containing protein